MEGRNKLINKLFSGNLSEFEAKTLMQQNKNISDLLAKRLEEEGATKKDLDCLEQDKAMGKVIIEILERKYPSYNLNSP